MKQQDFTWSDEKEPHFQRRKVIMEEYPEVKKLFGNDPSLIFKTLFVAALQLAIPIFFLPENPWLFALLVLLVGTTLTHIIVLAIHEITHDLAFKKKVLNNWLAILVNFPLVVPFAMAFKAYHAKHHWHQGKEGVDTDLAVKWEARVFRGPIGKFIWLIIQIPVYAIRPIFVHPMVPDKWQIINALFQISAMVGFYFLAGWAGLLYLALSTALATGLHPISGHFVAEHFIYKEGQETYSYYGWWNKLIWNVGYHNEHHDFPTIPGSKLPELKKIAGKHYDNLYSHQSYAKVIWRFLFDNKISLFSRVKRNS
ncbi:MAG: fatty acid desaturase [Ekhidna sp.]|uniref:fatty acid desaturase n=1 Tax=Ekhidna sp. TaxID=2608089 RepID=UPI0032EB5896